jgi:hypothetical protein
MRRVLHQEGDSYVILPRGRELISYYANGVVQICGAYEQRVRGHNALPVDTFIGT